MRTKYYNDAFIGNKNILATYSKKGELLRLYYPNPDFRQFIDFFGTGVKINDSGMIYLHEDINNKYNQYYDEDTNILNTEVENLYYRLKIKQIDYASIKKDVIIKQYVFENGNSIDLNINFLVHSKLIYEENNAVGSQIKNNALIQYCHDYALGIFSKDKIYSHQLNDVANNIQSGVIQDKDYIGMSADSAVSYNIGTIKPGEKKEFVLFVVPVQGISEGENLALLDKIEEIRKLDVKAEKQNASRYWKKFVKDHYKLDEKYQVTNKNYKGYLEKLNKIYKRSILLFPLLMDEVTGGIVASAEADEGKTQCGRYAYCWPRDAVFICSALDKIGMTKEVEKFYKVFCKNTQSKNGMWEQRFYTDGKLAPCWGYQIDETASVIYGIYEHYKVTKEEKFIKDTFKMCDKAVRFLERYMDNILGTKDESDVVKKEIEETYHTEDREKLPLSYDLWEMNEGVHLYSIASINAAYNAMLKIYEIIEPEYKENRLKLENIHKNIIRIKKQMEVIPKYVSQNLYNEKTKTLKRNLEDDKTDISILGSIYPFEMFGPKEKKVLNTIEKINMTLRTYTGGYLRFEQDSYRGGKNPWPISTLWMAMYYQKAGENKKAKECIEFVVKSCNEHGLLGEQVDNSTLEPNWVVGLGWSHAMFILSLGN